MKILLRVFCTTAGLFFLSVFWLPRDAAQSGITYTDTVTASFTGHNLKHPTGLAVEPTNTEGVCGASGTSLWISDTGNNTIKVFNAVYGYLCTIAGDGNAGYRNAPGLTNSEFNSPTGIDVVQEKFNAGRGTYVYVTRIYVTDSNNYVVRWFCEGAYTFWDLSCPGQPGRNMAIANYAGSNIKGYLNGAASQAEFAHQGAMHSALGYTVDTENHAIRSVGANVGTFAGTGSPGLVNGPVATARFNFPTKLAKDTSGSTYVADAGNHVIRRIDSGGNVTTFAGYGVPGYADGTGASAQFRLPTGMVYNSNDNAFYVADSGNNRIRRITMAGTVTTYAGNGIGGFVNGSLLQSEFRHPTDIVVLGTNLVVSDTYNNAIRLIDTSTGTVSTLID
jgi:hypothetical protein